MNVKKKILLRRLVSQRMFYMFGNAVHVGVDKFGFIITCKIITPSFYYKSICIPFVLLENLPMHYNFEVELIEDEVRKTMRKLWNYRLKGS